MRRQSGKEGTDPLPPYLSDRTLVIERQGMGEGVRGHEAIIASSGKRSPSQSVQL